ncbi:MAG: efflux RND transporter periplasmic adaptor subunit [Azoarcus sp.]|jgi:RND family efflux transporter MFP subunit|nr:efflux RND transporter periplasmic adaptor subunit [Azoarcus sp.]
MDNPGLPLFIFITMPTPKLHLCVLLCAALLAACGSRDDAARAPRPALAVTVVRPAVETWPIRVSANGNIAAWQEAIIGSDVQALRLTEVRVDVGDAVTAGQILAAFDDEPVKIDVAQAKAALAQAHAAVKAARENATRARELRGSGALSEQLVTQYLTTEQSALAQSAAAKAALAAQELRLARTRVLAPDDGVISARNATVGAVSGVGTELFRLIRKGRLEWRAELTEAELERLAPGVPVRLALADGRSIAGTARMVAPTVDARTRTGLAYVDLPPDAGLRPGMFARGEFDLGESVALTVPLASVAMREAFSYVFRLEAGDTVRQVKVSTGRRVGERMEITGGLAKTARIVAAGANFLNDGDRVRVVDDLPSGADAAAQ